VPSASLLSASQIEPATFALRDSDRAFLNSSNQSSTCRIGLQQRNGLVAIVASICSISREWRPHPLRSCAE
jgi:hypothetical protein